MERNNKRQRLRNEDLDDEEEISLKNQSGDFSKSKSKAIQNDSDTPLKKNVFPRLEVLAKPRKTNLLDLWQSGTMLSKTRLRRIRVLLEEDFSLTPNETVKYFQHLDNLKKRNRKKSDSLNRLKIKLSQKKEFDKRQEWLLQLANEISERLSYYVINKKHNKLVSERLKQIADTVLDRVCCILGETKPSRRNPGKLQRFMVAVSDRIAVWIANVLYQSELDNHEEENE